MPSKQRTKGGPKLTRSRNVTIRLDPKTHYIAELAARIQRRTLSSYIEWAITNSFEHIYASGVDAFDNTTLSVQVGKLWDVNEAERFVKLALDYPELLTYDEQVLWKVIHEGLAHERFAKEWDDTAMDWVKSNWEAIKQYAAGEIDEKEFHSLIDVPF